MKDKLNHLKKILLANQDKRILVLSASEISAQNIYHSLAIGKLYNDVLDDLLVKEYGAIEKWYVKDEERKKVESQIKIVKGIPLFSQKTIDCDLILFLKVDPQVLKILCAYEKTSYPYILKKQQELFHTIKDLSCKVKIVEIYPEDSELKKMPRNVYVCGNPYYYLEGKRDIKNYDNDNHFHFPYIKKVETLEDLKRKQGFLLIIDEDKLHEKDILKVDKKYRPLFNHFQFVYILTDDEKKINFYHLKYSNIYYVCRDFPDYDSIMELYYTYLLTSKEIKFSQTKKKHLERLNLYLKKKKTVTTNEIAQEFSLNYRRVERYMNDCNQIYKNIGYDFKENAWYIIK